MLPEVLFIKEDVNGYIEYPFRIRGYCSHDGKYICIRRGLAPKEIVATTIHEMRHAYQCQDAKRHKSASRCARETRDFLKLSSGAAHSNSGDAATLTHTLNEILKDDLDRLWKKACASARARLN